MIMGSIVLHAGNFAPKGFSIAQGQLLDIHKNIALFSLLGTMYGGNGYNNFALPDMRELEKEMGLTTPGFSYFRHLIATEGIYPYRADNACDRAFSGETYLSQVLIFPYSFEIGGFSKCDGKVVSEKQCKDLSSMIGNGASFSLPDTSGFDANIKAPVKGIHHKICHSGPLPSYTEYSDAFLGMVTPYAGKVAPGGWAFCDGTTLSVNDNEALFFIIGSQYGGDWKSTFSLPNTLELESKLNKSATTSKLRYIICVQGFFPVQD